MPAGVLRHTVGATSAGVHAFGEGSSSYFAYTSYLSSILVEVKVNLWELGFRV